MRSGMRPGEAAAFPADQRASERWAAAARGLFRRVGFAPPLLLLAFLLPPPDGAHIAGIPSLCAFHNLTGLPCPGCGITRSVVCCAHGLWHAALAYHPLGPPVFVGLITVALARLLRLRVTFPPRLVHGAAWASLVLVGVIWAARLSGALPSPP